MKASVSPPIALWLVFFVASSLVFGYAMYGKKGNADIFLPGKTTHGHYQIEMSCAACHDPDMGFQEESCLRCHAQELEAVDDSHPKSKFNDPRNADRLEKLDASRCVTCHTEHVEGRTHEMGVTVPKDYCFQCHEDIAEERESHRGMGFETCATAGCHNYHDNKALYEDFLVKHAGEPDIKSVMTLLGHPQKDKEDPSKKLTMAEADFSRHGVIPNDLILNEWHESSHAQQGVSCSDCHDQGGVWMDKPNHESCQTCHDTEVKGFLQGKHGMRLAEGLSAMTPAMARQPMHRNAGHKKLSCVSCHASHQFDREEASMKACMSCHNDEHTNQYLNSKHFGLWAEKGFDGGVSCATCHMPRLEDKEHGYVVQHNQNANLRPNEKMIREVCMDCHGLSFSIDALADPELVKRNFIGLPSEHIKSIDMATHRD